MSFSRDTIRRVFVGVAATPKGNYTNCKSRTQVRKCENSTRVVFSRSPGTEIYSSFDTPLGSFTGEDGVLIPPRVEYRVEFLPPEFHPLFHSY